LKAAIAEFKTDNPEPWDEDEVLVSYPLKATATVLTALEDAIDESKGTDWKIARAFAAIHEQFDPDEETFSPRAFAASAIAMKRDLDSGYDGILGGTPDLTLIDVLVRAVRLPASRNACLSAWSG
jgi:hypothetical protein